MARIVLGIATSHTPMLNTPAKDWPSFIDRDAVRDFLDKDGNHATYEELLSRPDPRALPELTPERFAARHDEAQAAVDYLKQSVRRAELDALIILGDDQKELFYEDHLPSILVYYGDTIRNVPLSPNFKGPEWSRLATARYYEEKEPRDYPVAAPLALHLIEELIDREFDIASSNGLLPGHGEGHAHAFVRKRLMESQTCRSCRYSSIPITRQTSPHRGAATNSAGRSARRSRAGRATPASASSARVGSAISSSMRSWIAASLTRSPARTARRCNHCRAKSSIPAARKSACGSRSAARLSIWIWHGRTMSRATALRPGPAPGSVSPFSSEVGNEQTEGQRGSRPRRPRHGHGRDDAAVLAAGGDVVGTASATARRCG